MVMPAMPGAGFIMVEAEFVLGRLETFLNPPTCSFHADQSVDRRAVRAPGGEIGAFTTADAAPDQQTARPQTRRGGIELCGVKIGQRAIGPVVEPFTLVPNPADRRCDASAGGSWAIFFASPGPCPTAWCRSGLLSSIDCVVRLPILAS